MTLRSNEAEFRRLDKEIVRGTEEVEEKKWRQAELAYEAYSDGTSQGEYAKSVGKTRGHIGILVRMWDRVSGEGVREPVHLPVFADAYEQTRSGQEGVTSSSARSRRAGRQMPKTTEDRTLVLGKIVAADPAAVDRALDDSVVRNRLKHRVDEDEKKREARRERERAKDKADPAGKVIRNAIREMDSYSRTLDLMSESWTVALEDIPPELKARLRKSAEKLEAAAHRMVAATKGIRSLRSVR